MTDSTYHPGQLSAIAGLRWQLFVNTLRTTRGKMELVSRVIIAIVFAVGGLGGALGMAFAAHFMISSGKPELLALLLWPMFLFWQVFPVMATAFANNPDSSDLLRFPLNYRSYFLVRLAYGSFDPTTLTGTLWSLGILLGVATAKPALLPWAFLVLLAFAAFNLLCMQMIFSWVERWLSQRRTRELMSILVLFLMLSLQLIGPLIRHFGKRARREAPGFIDVLSPVQAKLPPGLAADAIAQAADSHFMAGLSSLALLCGFSMMIGYALHVRLRAQYRGENLSEVAAASTRTRDRSRRLGWNLPGFPAPVATVFEKEVRYILRSGPMLLNLILPPLFVLVVFRFGSVNHAWHFGGFLARPSDVAFPVAAAYILLMLTNMICNNFGGDGGGIQFFFASPTNFREIVLGKNITHTAILLGETVLAWIVVSLLYGRPSFHITIATLAALLFAAPANFAAGNLLSIYSPRKLDYSSFRQQRPSQTSVLVSLGVQFSLVGIGVLAFWLAIHFGNIWIATLLLLALSGISLLVYRTILNRMDGLALERRETLVAEMCRA
jgi:ABC-2 type transport system permease protein